MLCHPRYLMLSSVLQQINVSENPVYVVSRKSFSFICPYSDQRNSPRASTFVPARTEGAVTAAAASHSFRWTRRFEAAKVLLCQVAKR